MNTVTMHKFILFVGFMLILHAAYSAAQHRSYLRITEQEFTSLPTDLSYPGKAFALVKKQEFPLLEDFLILLEDWKAVKQKHGIIIQGIVSLFVVMYGVLHTTSDFREIRAIVELENKSWETLRNLPSFQIFYHRGRLFSTDYFNVY